MLAHHCAGNLQTVGPSRTYLGKPSQHNIVQPVAFCWQIVPATFHRDEGNLLLSSHPWLTQEIMTAIVGMYQQSQDPRGWEDSAITPWTHGMAIRARLPGYGHGHGHAGYYPKLPSCKPASGVDTTGGLYGSDL